MTDDLAPRWRPRNEGDIAEVIEAGLLRETHYLDVKREVGDTPGARKESARDLASFALHGGALLIGVAEDKEQRTWSLAPIALDTQAERLENIATLLVDRPLFIRVADIPTADDPSKGYLLVDIPPSPRAPHMVDGTYYGRGDRTRIRLSDAEVVLHHARRESAEVIAGQLLDTEIARDPTPVREQQSGRLYGIAQPVNAQRDVALSLVRTGDTTPLRNLILQPASELGSLAQFAPTVRDASTSTSRAEGIAFCSYEASGPGRSQMQDGYTAHDSRLLDIEIREDAGIRLLMGRMTAEWGRHGSIHAIADGLAVAYTRYLVAWAAGVGEAVGYRGAWGLGIHGTRMRGLQSHMYHERLQTHHGPTYDAQDYRGVTRAMHVEMVEQPWEVANRLVGRLIRALNTEHIYGEHLRPSAVAT